WEGLLPRRPVQLLAGVEDDFGVAPWRNGVLMGRDTTTTAAHPWTRDLTVAAGRPGR
ncbi:unnamed protein product, partial [Urochloa humidicola]